MTSEQTQSAEEDYEMWLKDLEKVRYVFFLSKNL